MALSTLDDKSVDPTHTDLKRVLGASEGLWLDIETIIEAKMA